MKIDHETPITEQVVLVDFSDDRPIRDNYAGKQTGVSRASITYRWDVRDGEWRFQTGKYYAGLITKSGEPSKSEAEYYLSTYKDDGWATNLIAACRPTSAVTVISTGGE